MVQYFQNHVQIGTGPILGKPFFGDTQYTIPQILVIQKDGVTSFPTDSAFQIMFDNQGNISFSDPSSVNAANIASAVLFKCGVSYAGYSRSVVMDKRTGMIDIR